MAQAVVVDVLEKLLFLFFFFFKLFVIFFTIKGWIHLVTIQRQLQRYQIEQSPRDL